MGMGGDGARRVASRRRSISIRMSRWEYSHERETPPARATVSKVIGVPAWSSSRRAWMALARVSSRRRWAVEIRGPVLSARIGSSFCLATVAVVFERGDDPVEVVGDLAVHLDLPELTAGFGGGDDLEGVLAVSPVLG